MQKTERIALTIKEAAGAIGVSPNHVRNQIKSGDLKTVRVGRRVLITNEALLQWLNAPTENPYGSTAAAQ